MIDVVDRLLAAAARQPDHLAVVEGARRYDYASFCLLVGRLARVIAAAGPHPKVAIHLPQGAEAYAAMYAALMAGGYYVPMNHGAPAVKLQSICEQFMPDLVIGRPDSADILACSAAVIDPASLGGEPMIEARPPHDLAYVIFTSGSTGKPKGVAVPRAGLNHYVAWAVEALELTPSDRCSQHPTIAFDVSVTDIFGGLAAGATLYPIVSAMDRLMPGQAIRRLGLTVWNSVPSVIDLMLGAKQVTPEHLASLRLINFLGEPLLAQHMTALFAARPDLIVNNTYGPTEATVSMTCIRLTASDWQSACRSTLSIGPSIPGMGTHLIGGAHPDEGEIVITGPQLARGYWNNPELTAKAFRSDPDLPAGEIGYFTGDWAERHDGNIYFRWRRDFQVKVNGYRVEIDEVNGALRRCGYANAQTALAGGQLTAFLEMPEPEVPDQEALRVALAALLEPYAIPTRFVAVAQFPRNQNDKIDLPALIASLSGPDITP